MVALEFIMTALSATLSGAAMAAGGLLAFRQNRRLEREREALNELPTEAPHPDLGLGVHPPASNGKSSVQSVPASPGFAQVPQKAQVDLASMASRYLREGVGQSKSMFRFTLVFAGLGFLLVATACLWAVLGLSTLTDAKVLVPLVSGTIMDALSGVLFVQAGKSQRLMVDFFDRVRKDQRLHESLELVKQVKDDKTRDRLVSALALRLADDGLGEPTMRLVIGSHSVQELVAAP